MWLRDLREDQKFRFTLSGLESIKKDGRHDLSWIHSGTDLVFVRFDDDYEFRTTDFKYGWLFQGYYEVEPI